MKISELYKIPPWLRKSSKTLKNAELDRRRREFHKTLERVRILWGK